jgi:ferredoxin
VVECPTGTPLIDILTMCGADVGPGILVGGYHGKWITAEAAMTVTVSRKGFASVGGTFGAGMIIPIGSATCALGEVAQVTQYLAGESAGQCGPCRLGLPDLARAVTLVALGGSALENVRAAAGVVKGRGACSHPDGTARFALSALEVFHRDVEAHAGGEGCGKQVRGILPLPYHSDQGARKLAVDWSRCDGHGLCSAVAPEIIRLDANGFPAFPQTPLPPWLENGARRAVNVCPALALRLTEATV